MTQLLHFLKSTFRNVGQTTFDAVSNGLNDDIKRHYDDDVNLLKPETLIHMWRGYLTKQAQNALAARPLTVQTRTLSTPGTANMNAIQTTDVSTSSQQRWGTDTDHQRDAQSYYQPSTPFDAAHQGRGFGRGRGRDQRWDQRSKPKEQRAAPRVSVGPGWAYDPIHDTIAFEIKKECTNCGLKGHNDDPCPFKGPNDTFNPLGVLNYCTAGDLTDIFIARIRMHCRYCRQEVMTLTEWENVRRQMIVAVAKREEALPK